MASEKESPALTTLSVALLPDLADKVRKVAKSEDRSVSTWIRRAILKALESNQ